MLIAPDKKKNNKKLSVLTLMMPPLPFAGFTWILVFSDFCYYFACWSQRCLLIYISTYQCACMYACMHVCMFVCMYTYVHMYLWMYAYISLQRFEVLDLEVKEKVADPGDKRIKPAPCWENATSTESEALTSSYLASSFLDT
jgi:hypothetical protein